MNTTNTDKQKNVNKIKLIFIRKKSCLLALKPNKILTYICQEFNMYCMILLCLKIVFYFFSER